MIENWKESWKMFSVQAAVVIGVIASLEPFVPFLSQHLPEQWVSVAAVLVVVARLIKQSKLHKATPQEVWDQAQKAAGRSATMLVVLLAMAFSGCTIPLEKARTAGIESRQAGTTVESSSLDDRCRTLDNQRTTWGAAAKGAGALSGASGLATVPIEGQEATIAMASAAAGLAAAAVVAVYVEESKGAAWARECAER